MFRLYIRSHNPAGYRTLNKKTIKVKYSTTVGMGSLLYINVQLCKNK